MAFNITTLSVYELISYKLLHSRGGWWRISLQLEKLQYMISSWVGETVSEWQWCCGKFRLSRHREKVWKNETPHPEIVRTKPSIPILKINWQPWNLFRTMRCSFSRSKNPQNWKPNFGFSKLKSIAGACKRWRFDFKETAGTEEAGLLKGWMKKLGENI